MDHSSPHERERMTHPTTSPETHNDDAAAASEPPVPVVGVGASAGGLAAFRALLAALPPDTGMAFVLIQHLSATHSSALADLLAADSPLPVQQVTDGLTVAPNRVYVIAPGQLLTLLCNGLHCLPHEETAGPPNTVDTFLESLAADRGPQAIGVILSGTGSDGMLGCRAIKAAGGLTFAQDSQSAEHDGMPRSAARAGCIDRVLPPREIAQELARLSPHLGRTHRGVQRDEALILAPEQLSKIAILLRARTGHDFSGYKPATLTRRIQRRMLVSKISQLNRYIAWLQRSPEELDALFGDLLINVSGFFRDPEV